MGSFWGHVDEGIFFILISIWWTVNACWIFMENSHSGKEKTTYISFTVKCKKEIPVETIFKILFPLGGFLAETIADGLPMLDEEGNFIKMVNAQHMTIYGIFVLHAVIDLLTWFGVPMIPGAAYFSGALAFVWYGVAFYYHSQMHGKEPLEVAVHVIPMGIMMAAAGAYLLESWWRSGVWTILTRAFAVLTLGTWFTHAAFMLYAA